MSTLKEEIAQVANSDAKVLITGESGVGKELVARAIQSQGPRATRPFVVVNCAGLPETLLESEFFGHVKGSFTGAYRDKPGKLEIADTGTVFLDEIGEMTLRMQSLMLRFLETGELQKVGAERSERVVNVRVIGATNRDLRKLITEGLFREDLFYRLNVITLLVPPLRERKEDVPILIEHFLKRFTRDRGLPAREISPEAMRALCEYQLAGQRARAGERDRTARRDGADRSDRRREPVRRSEGAARGRPRGEAGAAAIGRRQPLQHGGRRRTVVLDGGLPALHAAGHHARADSRSRPAGSSGDARVTTRSWRASSTWSRPTTSGS